MFNKSIALVLGHHRHGDSGAVSVDGTTEKTYNTKVINLLETKILTSGGKPHVYKKSESSSYTQSVNELVHFLKAFKCVVGIELHFNSFDGAASEEEYIYWHSSSKGKLLATALHTAHQKYEPDNLTRGIKPRLNGRGAYALKATPCPYVICEPFFGDSNADWTFWQNRHNTLANIYHDGLKQYFELLKV